MESPDLAYGHFWHKYRPVILRLMVDASEGPQQYQLSSHEFTSLFPKNRTNLAFLLYIHKSKAINNIKTSPLAYALLNVLQQSRTAIKLTEDATYELWLDTSSVFHVRKSDGVEGT